MKNILVLIHDDEGQEARLQVALDLTRALEGHLACLDVTMVPNIAGDYDGTGSAMLIADERKREADNKASLEARLASEDVVWSWSDVTGFAAEAVLDAAALADLIILNRKLDRSSHPDMHALTSRIVSKARKPVVAVPDNGKGFKFGRALIAWDGQASAAATMRACVPLLALAEEVQIFMARDGAEQTEPREAAEYLSRHNIHASIRIVDDGLTAADELIADEAANWHADYILMGAYGRGRLMETFGGVTRRMLATATLPLILGH
ncbi:universal stress protein family protein [Hephaestia caeni]|uniref:Universal stress protein family protein n=1 Tax=Hephaestia caeni TaxID=645617 RepID=A0A397PDA4_9SPHN|nr:universal stress protein [Hephaestia caeni]RIA46383.1 universal stress protein family protein [Hephaestia caeni]